MVSSIASVEAACVTYWIGPIMSISACVSRCVLGLVPPIPHSSSSLSSSGTSQELKIQNCSKRPKTYNSEDSLVVTHPTTNSPACGLSTVNSREGVAWVRNG